MKFVTDGMLGKLTRWLRILGHDVIYLKSADDNKLIQITKSEKRILLTCDNILYQKATKNGIQATLIQGTNLKQKLVELTNKFKFKLELDLILSRCSKCNEKIKTCPKDQIINQIPKLTSLHYSKFWKCNGCSQIYWQGPHWKHIQKTLKEINQEIRIE